MRFAATFILALGLAQASLADGPSPSLQPAPGPGQGGAVAPAPAPFRLAVTTPTAPQNFDEFVPDDWAKDWKHYHWTEAKRLWDEKEALFLDARAKVEYDQGHIPGAIPMPLGEFDKYYDLYKGRIKKAKYLITYCHGIGCKLSDKVAQRLYLDKGLKNTGAFFGGWPQWQQHNLPIEVSTAPKKR